MSTRTVSQDRDSVCRGNPVTAVTGTAVGVLFIGILQNGLSIAGVQSFWQQVITGLILLLAVMIDQVGTPTWLRLPQRRGSEPTAAQG